MVYGYSGLGFHVILNLPPTLTKNNYDMIAKTASVAIKEVAEETMSKIAQEVAERRETDDNKVADVAVSGDGTWEWRGYSSLNGVFVIGCKAVIP